MTKAQIYNDLLKDYRFRLGKLEETTTDDLVNIAVNAQRAILKELIEELEEKKKNAVREQTYGG